MKKTDKIQKFLRKPIPRNVLGVVGVYLVVLIVAALSLWLLTRHGKEIKVPDFTGMSVSEASQSAHKARLKVLVSDSVYVKGMPCGHVYRQMPAGGNAVKQGRTIRLVINAVMPKMVTMPNVLGYSLRQATSEIIGAGLRVGTLRYENDFATNNVLAQRYRGENIEAGTQIESDAPIDLILGVNASENATTVPDLLGQRMIPAIDILHDNSLNVGRMYFDRDVRDYTDSLNAVVYRQSPDIHAGRVRLGGGVNLYLTLDPEKVPQRSEAQ